MQECLTPGLLISAQTGYIEWISKNRYIYTMECIFYLFRSFDLNKIDVSKVPSEWPCKDDIKYKSIYMKF